VTKEIEKDLSDACPGIPTSSVIKKGASCANVLLDVGQPGS